MPAPCLRPLLFGLFLVCGTPLAAAPTLEDAREAYGAGRTAEAVELFHEVAARAAESGDASSAGIAYNNACVILTDLGELDTALADCRRALDLRLSLDDTRALSRTHNNLGLVLQHLARFDEAEDEFLEALRLNRERDDPSGETVNLANLGVTATQAGWYSKAIDFQRRALDVATAHEGEPWAADQARLARINRAVVLERIGAFREALALYDQALQSSGQMTDGQRATLLLNRGVIYRNLGDPYRARDAFLEAEATYRRVGDASALSNAQLNLGLVLHLNLEDPEGAEPYYREALRLSETTGDLAEGIQDLYYLGRLLIELRRLDEAAAVFTRCLGAAEESGSSEGRWEALAGLGRVESARGDLPSALTHLEQAIEEIERVRGSLPGQALRAGYFGDKRAVYGLAIDLLATLDAREPGASHAERALGLAHRAKARVLLDALGSAAGPVELPSVGEIAARVGDDLLIEFFVGESRLFSWTVRRDRIELRAVDAPESILASVSEVHETLAGGGLPEPRVLDELARALLGQDFPVSRRPIRLRIAPDGGLHHLPFELLPVGDGRRLVDAFTVSYLPSGAALAGLQREHERRRLAFVGFGDPELPTGDGETQTPAGLLVTRFGLGPLPAAARELEAASRRLAGPSEIVTGARATPAAFAASVSGGARVVHLASHTVLDERPGRGAAILLSPDEESDGLMLPQEIAGLDLPVDLTVLAACSTALGEPDRGGALTMLTGAFLAAGSEAVLATLWDVGDAATGVFMDQFYYRLGLGEAPAVALREAKRRMLADSRWSDPALWSAYVLVGETGPVAAPRRRGWWAAVVIALVGVAIWLGYGRMRKRSDSERPMTAPSASRASTRQR